MDLPLFLRPNLIDGSPVPTPLNKKSTLEQIRERFDADVERFSNLSTGQATTIDAALSMELITEASVAATNPIQRVLDIGCGAGNNSIKLRQTLGTDFDIDLVDLSHPMLERARKRLTEINAGKITVHQNDFRKIEFPENHFDVVMAAAVLHHLRETAQWSEAFEKIYNLLRPGGSFWITDLVIHESPAIQAIMWKRYGDYLVSLGGNEFRENVFEYIDAEDSPRSVTFQLELLSNVGFSTVELLHKNSCFAAFGAIK